MLTVTLVQDGTHIEMPSLQPGQSGSLSDCADSSLIVFGCNDDDSGGEVYRSVKGVHAESGNLRLIHSFCHEPIATIKAGGEFSMAFTGIPGELTLLLRHSRAN